MEEEDGSPLVPCPETIKVPNGSVTDNGDGSVSLTFGESMVYPASGLAKSTGSAWDTSITDNSSNWNTAYSWGNHASAGYLTSESDPVFTSWDKDYADLINTPDIDDLLPSQTGNSGKYLTTDGTNASWATVSGSGDVTKVGTPVDNQVGVWTGDGTIEGDSNFTWDGSDLDVIGDFNVFNGAIGTSPYYGVNYYTFDSGGMTAYPLINITNARGTYASPSAQWSGRPLGGFSVQSWNGSAYEDFFKIVTWVGNQTTSHASRSSKTVFTMNRSGVDQTVMTLNGFAAYPGVSMGDQTSPTGAGALSIANTSGNANMIFQSGSNFYSMGQDGTYFIIRPNAYFNGHGFFAASTNRNVVVGYAATAYVPTTAKFKVMDIETSSPAMEIVTSSATTTQKLLSFKYNWNTERAYITSGGGAYFYGLITNAGGIIFPSSDPHISGAWWDNSGTLTKSSG